MVDGGRQSLQSGIRFALSPAAQLVLSVRLAALFATAAMGVALCAVGTLAAES